MRDHRAKATNGATASAGRSSRTHEGSTVSTTDTANPMRPRIQKRRSSLTGSKPECRTLRQRVHQAVFDFYDWKNKHHYLGRYSVEKLLAFEDYQRETSITRVLAVVLLTPVPSLLSMYALAAIPLRSPLLGAAGNVACFIQSALAYTLMTFGMLLSMRQSLGWTDDTYSIRDALVLAALTAATNEGFMAMLAYTWQFPVPFRDLVGVNPFAVWFTVYHVVLAGHKIRPRMKQLVQYAPLFCCEASTLFIFETISLAFKHMSVKGQVVLAICFPFIKAMLKRMIWFYTHRLEDISTDVTVCVVEIFGSLFQNICIQNMRSLKVGALIIVIDFAQAVLETKMYLSRKFVVDGKVAVTTAVKIVESALFPGASKANQDLQYAATKRTPGTKRPRIHRVFEAGATFSGKLRRSSSVILSHQPSASLLSFFRSRSSAKIVAATTDSMLNLNEVDVKQTGSKQPSISTPDHDSAHPNTSSTTQRRISIDDVILYHRELANLLTQTLQLLFASEVLVFVEYVEFMVPVLYALYSLVLFHLPYAQYSLQFIGMTRGDFWTALFTTCAYAALECVSMLLLFYLVRVKYGLSALYQLAFVLENYALGVQGKLLGSLVLIFNLNTVHHGMDLSLEFDWAKVLNGTAGT